MQFKHTIQLQQPIANYDITALLHCPSIHVFISRKRQHNENNNAKNDNWYTIGIFKYLQQNWSNKQFMVHRINESTLKFSLTGTCSFAKHLKQRTI